MSDSHCDEVDDAALAPLLEFDAAGPFRGAIKRTTSSDKGGT